MDTLTAATASTSVSSVNNGIRTEVSRSPITLDKLSKADFQKEGTLTAQLRQEVVTKSFYPGKKVESNMQNSLFDTAEFGFSEQEFVSKETRVAFVLVPASKTEAEVKAMLDSANKAGAVIYKVLDTKPILDENQKYSISQGQKTMDDYANAQIVRYPDTHAKAGQVILDSNGNVQYRKTYFWKSATTDQDNRANSTPYVSALIQAELEGASKLEGQTL